MQSGAQKSADDGPYVAGAALTQLQSAIGEERVSDWITIDQPMIDAFADITGDHQFIHVDPARAAMTPFGGTIAHGFLTLSLLPRLMAQIEPDPLPGVRMTVNYGTNHLRFVSPVRAGKRVRGRSAISSAVLKHPGQIELVRDFAMEIEGEEKPAFVTQWIVQLFF